MLFKKNNGVTLLALTITIIIMMIISGTIIYQLPSYIGTRKVNKLYNDIESLNSKVDEYYTKYGELPVFDTQYCNKEQIQTLLQNNAQNYKIRVSNNILPSEYIQLEYIESTGTQYIDLGITPTSNTKIEINSYGTRQGSNALFGSRNSSNNSTRMVLFQRLNDEGTHQRISPQFSTNTAETYELSYDGFTKIILDKTGCYTDDTPLITYTTQTISGTTFNLYLFTFNEAGTPDSRNFIGKVKYFKLWENNVLVRNMIPCMNSANVIGLYDTVNNKFYTNAGTGSFIPGPDIILNPNDEDEYYVLDLEKLDGLTLNYGYGNNYQTIKQTPSSISLDIDDIYIINKESHQIYYPAGIKNDNEMYYTYFLESNSLLAQRSIENTGTYSINLPNNIFGLSDLKIYGNNTDDHTTASTPELGSVGDYDEETGKYMVPIKIGGKNLFHYNNSKTYQDLTLLGENSEVNINGTNTSNIGNTYESNNKIILKKDTNYTLSYHYISGSIISAPYKFWIGFCNQQNSWVGENQIGIYPDNYSVLHRQSIRVNEHTNVSFRYIGWGEFNNLVFGMQLEEGTTATGYEPYIEPTTYNIILNEPLRKIDDVYDYIDFSAGKVIRNIQKIDGTLSILDNPIEEEVDLPTIPTQMNRTVNILVDTDTVPAKMSAKYYVENM